MPAMVQETPMAKLAGLMLTGTVLAGPLRVALIKDAAGKDVRIPIGGSYEGWMLVSLESRRAVFRNGEATDEVIFPAQSLKAPDVNRVGGEVPSRPADVQAQTTPMMTLEAANQLPASEPLDDTAIRQAKLESLKDIVAHRRAGPSINAEGH